MAPKTKRTFVNLIGDVIHEIVGSNGPMLVKKLDMSVWLPTDEQYCPECHKRMEQLDGYFECSSCGYSITDDEVEYGDGYPTLESTYEDDYDEYYDEDE